MFRGIVGVSTHSIYYKSPIFMQHAFTSAYGYKLKRERYNRLYRDALNRYVSGGFDREAKLVDFMSHLKNNIAAYADIDVDQGDILQSFMKLTMTTKSDLRYDLDSRSFKKGQIRFSGTSGTTGESLAVYDSEYDRADRMAYLDYIKFKNGVPPFSRRASFTGQDLTPPDHRDIIWRHNIPMNQVLYAANHLTQHNIGDVYRHLAKFKPFEFDGFPSAIHMVAKYMLANGIKAPWGVKAIFPTAEILLPHVKMDIERAFDAPVIDQYASGEGAPFIYGNGDGTYSIGHETGLFEFLRVGSLLYEMVVTSFINYATPIVRYKIGDHVEIDSNAEYLNTYHDDVQILKIFGRASDYLIGSRMNRVTSVGIARAVEGIEDQIAAFQFVQEDLKRFVVYLVVEDDYDDRADRLFKKRVVRRLGADSDIEYRYVGHIPREKNGKIRFIKNAVADAG